MTDETTTEYVEVADSGIYSDVPVASTEAVSALLNLDSDNPEQTIREMGIKHDLSLDCSVTSTAWETPAVSASIDGEPCLVSKQSVDDCSVTVVMSEQFVGVFFED